jgi:hypothetical protein
MNRRDALRALGVAATLPATPELLRWGRDLHEQLAAGPRPALRVLDPHQDATVTALADLILPATDTPGAKAARVNEFIDVLLADWYQPADRDRFLAGLADVDARATAAFGKTFVDGSPAEQAGLLVVLDDETARWRAASERTRGPEPFYRRMKWLTLFGYNTSEIGATQEQHFAIIPGRYVPCAPTDSLRE